MFFKNKKDTPYPQHKYGTSDLCSRCGKSRPWFGDGGECSGTELEPQLPKQEVFEADPIVNLDEVVDGEIYVRIKRTEWVDNLVAVNKLTNLVEHLTTVVKELQGLVLQSLPTEIKKTKAKTTRRSKK